MSRASLTPAGGGANNTGSAGGPLLPGTAPTGRRKRPTDAGVQGCFGNPLHALEQAAWLAENLAEPMCLVRRPGGYGVKAQADLAREEPLETVWPTGLHPTKK